MTRVRPVLLAGVVATLVGGCGGSSGRPDKPPRPGNLGTQGSPSPQSTGFDPAGDLVNCLRAAHITSHRTGPTEVLVDPPEAGVRVVFAGTIGEADFAQLRGKAEGAQVIGRALLYVGTASDDQLSKVEKCVNKAGLEQ